MLLIKKFKIISSFLFIIKLFGKKRFVNSVKVFTASIKPTNPIQKYALIIESYACILKIFVVMFLLSINVFISLGILLQNYENKEHRYDEHTNESNEFQYQSIHQDLFLTHPYFSENISRINTVKSRLILIIFLYFKVS